MTRSWVEISRRRLKLNLESIRRHLSASTSIIAVVKANAYGHGLDIIGPALLHSGIEQFAVATAQEGVELRHWGLGGPILVFGGCLPDEGDLFRTHDLTAALYDSRRLPAGVKVQVEIDTGMTRLGIPWLEAADFVRKCEYRIHGLYSHFASSENDPGFTGLQLRRFLEASEGLPYPRHICNSAALSLREAHLDYVRLGLALYGIAQGNDFLQLQPVLRWKTRVMTINNVPMGRTVGYGQTFSTQQRRSLIGVLPVGYADGYKRVLSNRAQVRVRGRLAPVAGRISMDLTSIDLTDLPEVQPGDEVTLLEADRDSPLSATALAELAGTIPYEILTSIGSRVKRVAID